MMGIKLRSAVDAQRSNPRKQFFTCKNIRQGNFHFPEYNISVSQRSVDTIGKLELNGKIILYVIPLG